MRKFHDNQRVTTLPDRTIFVFGANRQFLHQKGAALDASTYFGAIVGAGGLVGSSYALVTKEDWRVQKSSSIDQIKAEVDKFISVATERSDLIFYVTDVGCGLAGWTVSDIAPLFKKAPDNCILPESFESYVRPYYLASFKIVKDFSTEYAFWFMEQKPVEWLSDQIFWKGVSIELEGFHEVSKEAYDANKDNRLL